MEYSVKALADLAGVSVRTLHYYDEIGLLSPARVVSNGYRLYGAAELFRLQQILLYRELGFGLKQIASVLDRPDLDPLETLHEHRILLEEEIERLKLLVGTVDNTIARLRGEVEMDENEVFRGLSREEQESYRKEAVERWGEVEVSESYRLWDSYSQTQKQEIKNEGNAIYQDLVDCIPLGAADPQTQAVVARWHRHLRYFYEPSIARLRGLGEMYVNHPEFAERFRKMHPELPEFLRVAIGLYCDDLEQ